MSYFGAIRPAVNNHEELDDELWKLGIPARPSIARLHLVSMSLRLSLSRALLRLTTTANHGESLNSSPHGLACQAREAL